MNDDNITINLTPYSRYSVTLLNDDQRTGFKKGKCFHPKGVYFNGKNVVLVGYDGTSATRLALKATDVHVTVSP
jgi:hypothetical protein